MTDVIPAILPTDFDDLREHLALVRGAAPTVQIDVTDGQYIPDASWPYESDSSGVFERIKREEDALPFWQEFDFELDMMVHHAERDLPAWLAAGIRRVVVHAASETDIQDVLRQARELSREKDSILYTEVGVALKTTGPIEHITPYLDGEEGADTIDFVQCMGIERIGYQGEEFDERVLDQLEALRARYPRLPLSVDGSVNLDTAPMLVDSGATRLIAGSAIFESEHTSEVIEQLKEVCSQ